MKLRDEFAEILHDELLKRARPMSKRMRWRILLDSLQEKMGLPMRRSDRDKSRLLRCSLCRRSVYDRLRDGRATSQAFLQGIGRREGRGASCGLPLRSVGFLGLAKNRTGRTDVVYPGYMGFVGVFCGLARNDDHSDARRAGTFDERPQYH